MKPPFFLRKSGTLDVFDTVEELENRYPPDTRAEEDFIACDSEGRILLPGRASDGRAVLACDEQQPPSPDTLRSILREYLERSGISREEVDSRSLGDLVARVYADDHGLTAKVNAFLLHERYSDYVRSQLRDTHALSWLAGGLVAVPLLYFGTPHILAAYCQPVYFDAAIVLGPLESFALVASTIYVVERFIRRTARWQFSLKELFVVVTAFCVATSAAAHQSRYARILQEDVSERYLRGDYEGRNVIIVFYPPYPLLAVELWFLRLPLLFGVACLAYVVVKGALWGFRKAIRRLTLHWEHYDDQRAGIE
jgi:hypothetical protein